VKGRRSDCQLLPTKAEEWGVPNQSEFETIRGERNQGHAVSAELAATTRDVWDLLLEMNRQNAAQVVAAAYGWGFSSGP
jgi:hypothetical protein